MFFCCGSVSERPFGSDAVNRPAECLPETSLPAIGLQCVIVSLYRYFALWLASILSTTPMTTSTLSHFLPAEASRISSTQQAAEHPVRQCSSPCTQHGIQSGCGGTVSSPGECRAQNGADGLSIQPPLIPNACFPVRKALSG